MAEEPTFADKLDKLEETLRQYSRLADVAEWIINEYIEEKKRGARVLRQNGGQHGTA